MLRKTNQIFPHAVKTKAVQNNAVKKELLIKKQNVLINQQIAKTNPAILDAANLHAVKQHGGNSGNNFFQFDNEKGQ